MQGATSTESCSERLLLSERNRQLLREELAKQEQCRRKYIEITLGGKAGKGRPPRRTCRQRLAFYASSILALVAISGTCALLFLVPLYVDPALSTLEADFAPQPVACTTQRRDELWGLLNCSWSSCREGCTSELYHCTHIYVTYSPGSVVLNETDLYEETSVSESEEPLVDAVLLVNVKGCGYPPQVDCENFTRLWGAEGTRFPCYYSRVNRSVVLAEYDRQAELDIVWNYLALPLALTVSTTSLLCVWHCDCSCPPPRPSRNRARYNQQQTATGSSRASSRATSSAVKRPPPRNDIRYVFDRAPDLQSFEKLGEMITWFCPGD
ncbi:hypothetical protein QAD02_014434 [Eretmocerus hayati]|uniref:Uncharacterized protein n=1 Tax=Eretmocerus hayati TaxID=131215 RepID=A0ACC2P5J6_9HYME|nr:hypothetical protein QAD02_014434 [Eretmocerus hayati]